MTIACAMCQITATFDDFVPNCKESIDLVDTADFW